VVVPYDIQLFDSLLSWGWRLPELRSGLTFRFAADSGAPQTVSRRHDNLALHVWMQATEILIAAGLIEGEAEFILGIERR
jgi:hypothetical protein